MFLLAFSHTIRACNYRKNFLLGTTLQSKRVGFILIAKTCSKKAEIL